MLLALAIAALAIGFIALLFGFRKIASCSFAIGKLLFFIFLVVFVLLLVFHFLR